MPLVTLPFTIANGQLEDATPVMANFTTLATAINTLVVPLAGPATLTGTFTFSASPQVPTVTPGDNTTNAASTAFVTAAVGAVSGGVSSFKNKIINGAFVIDQRSCYQSTTPSATGAVYVCDRWAYSSTQSGKGSLQCAPGTAVAGYSHALSANFASAVTLISTDAFYLLQRIEADQIRNLGFGTAGALPVTLSFWTNCTSSGTFSGALVNGANNRCYVFSYAVASANTWTFIAITIPGDTTGTWPIGATSNNISGLAMELRFNYGSGSTFLGTAGAWGANNFAGATGSVQINTNVNGAISFTGVRLEVGSVATTDETYPLAVVFAQCQRYYEKSFPYSTLASQNQAIAGAFQQTNQYTAGANARTLGSISFKVQKRSASPTMILYAPTVSSAQIYDITAGLPWTSSAAVNLCDTGFTLTGTTPSGSAAGEVHAVHWSADAEL